MYLPRPSPARQQWSPGWSPCPTSTPFGGYPLLSTAMARPGCRRVCTSIVIEYLRQRCTPVRTAPSPRGWAVVATATASASGHIRCSRHQRRVQLLNVDVLAQSRWYIAARRPLPDSPRWPCRPLAAQLAERTPEQQICGTGGFLRLNPGRRRGLDFRRIGMEGVILVIDGPDSARSAARRLVKNGAQWIKTYPTGDAAAPESNDQHTLSMTREEMAAVVEVAHNHRRKVFGHCRATTGIKWALEVGYDSIEHGTYMDAECLEMMLDGTCPACLLCSSSRPPSNTERSTGCRRRCSTTIRRRWRPAPRVPG